MTGIPDDFEDEAGNGLEPVDLVKIMSGEEYPIMPFDVRSVLRLGLSPIVRKELWTTETANTLAHFLQLIEMIGSSPWLKQKLSIGTNSFHDSNSSVYSFECPTLNGMSGILIPYRQLYG